VGFFNRIACEFLHLLLAETEVHPGYGVVPDHIFSAHTKTGFFHAKSESD
jgi:hypothetical protein